MRVEILQCNKMPKLDWENFHSQLVVSKKVSSILLMKFNINHRRKKSENNQQFFFLLKLFRKLELYMV